MTIPSLKRLGNDYRVSWSDVGLQAEITRVNDTRSGVLAEVTFADVKGGEKRFIARRQINLATGAPGFVRDLEKLRLESEFNWAKVMEELAYLVLERHREGEPSIDLRDYEPQPRRWILEPFLEASGSTVLFGPGGSGKSFLALAMATSIAAGVSRIGTARTDPGPVLYIDFEADPDEHARRFQAIVRGMGLESRPHVLYRRERSPLHTVIDGLAREVAERNYVMVVVDSLGKARGGEPESAEVTLRMFNAIDMLRVPSLCVDHLSKEAMSRKSGHLSPFGSIYTENSARSTWSVDAADGAIANEKIVALVNRKSNNGPLAGRRGYKLVFGSDGAGGESLEISPHDVNDVPEFDHSLTLRERIANRLSDAPMTSRDLSEALDEAETTVRPMLSHMKKARTAILLKDSRWALTGEPSPDW